MSAFQVKVEDQGNLTKKLTITVPKESVKTAYDKAYNEIKGKVKVNGFRSGKMPQSLLEKRFEKYMTAEAMETLVPEYYEKAIKQEKIAPALQAKFADLEVQKDKPFVFSATVEVWPEFALPEYSKLKLKKKEVVISDEEIAKQRKQHLARFATNEPVDRAAQNDDHIEIDFSGKTEDGEEFDQPGYVYVLGSKQFIPEFESALQGMKKGEEKTFEAVLPADHPQEKYRAKKATFHVKINEVMEQKLPEETEEFFQKHYQGRAANSAEFTELLKKEAADLKEYTQKVDYRAELKEQLEKLLSFELPATPLQEEIGYRRHQLVQDRNNKLEGDALEAEAKKQAETHLRLARYIARVQEEEKIKIDNNEIYSRFNLNATMMGMDPRQLLQSEQGRYFYQETYQIVTEETVLDFITQKALA